MPPEADNVARIASLIGAAPVAVHGSVRVFGDWFGKPYDNDHHLQSVRADGDTLVLDFDEGERLTVWRPRGLALMDSGGIKLRRADRVRWDFFYYGRPRVDENRYRIEHIVDGPRVSATTTIDWAPVRFRPSLAKPALELLNPVGMPEAEVNPPIVWRLHLASPPKAVFECLATDAGRGRWWAESAVEADGWISWRWPDGTVAQTRVLSVDPPWLYRLGYLGGSTVTFTLADDGHGGTDLALTDEGVAETDWPETHAGWASVLMALKASVDHGIDLRNHDQARSWDQGYVDN